MKIRTYLLSVALGCMAPTAHAQFPAERTLTDVSGRKIEATILSASGESIRISRKSDGKEFVIQVAKLSAEDRKWIESMDQPDAASPVPAEKTEPTKPATEPTPIRRPTPVDRPGVSVLTPSKAFYRRQGEQGLVPPPKGWDALETTVCFKDGRVIPGYVYDVIEAEFWYAGRDMVQQSASLDELAGESLLEIRQWRNRTVRDNSPVVSLEFDGEEIHACVVGYAGDAVALLTDSGELMDDMPIAKFDKASQKFLEEWKAGTWKPVKTEWVIEARFTDAELFSNKGVALVKQEAKWGFIDSRGDFVEPPRYEKWERTADAPNFRVSEDGKWGLVAEDGSVVLPPGWEDVGDLHEGLIPVRSGGKWGYAEKGGNLVIPCTWDDAWRFSSSGLAVVTSGGKRGFLNRAGDLVMKPEWDGAILHSPDGIGAVRRGKEWFLVNRDGKLLSEPLSNFRWVNRSSVLGFDGKPVVEQSIIAAAKMKSGNVCQARQPGPFIESGWKRFRFTLPDKAGNDVALDEIGDTSGGIAAVRRGKKWGFADRNGILIEPQWDAVGRFSQGLAAVVNWGAQGRTGDISKWPWEFVDTSGKTIIHDRSASDQRWKINTRQHPWAPKFESGHVEVIESSWNSIWITDEGEEHPQIKREPEFEILRPHPRTAKQGKFGVIDLKGKVIFKPEWDRFTIEPERYFRVWRGGKMGLADEEGKMVLQPDWDAIQIGSEHWIGVCRDGRWGLADRSGKIILQPGYASINFTENGAAVMGRGNRQRVFWADGTELKESAELDLVYVDVYGSSLIFRKGDKDATEWWVGRNRTPGVWKLEGAGKVYWNKTLAKHERIWLQDTITGRWHFSSIDGNRLGSEMDEKPEKWFLDEGVGIIRDKDKAYFIDKDGKRLPLGEWEDASLFKNGFAAVKRNGLWGFIDNTGKLRHSCEYEEVGDFFIASTDSDAKTPLLAAVAKEGRWGYIGPKGGIIIPISHRSRGSWRFGRICIPRANRSWEMLAAYKADGTPDDTILPPRKGRENPHAGGWKITEGENSLWGLTDASGKVGLAHEWRRIVWVSPGVVAVRNPDGGGLFSLKDGWLFREDHERRILREEGSDQFDSEFEKRGFIVIQEVPKWGFARYLK